MAMRAFSLVCFLVTAFSAAAERPEDLLLIAHRGVVTDSISENSLAALEESIRRGYTHMEVDIRATKDGHAVCLHDSSLKRTTGIEKRIHEVTLSELGDLVDENTVPSLRTFCEKAAGRIELMPDVKDCPPYLAEQFGKSIAAALNEFNLMDNALFIGRHEFVSREAGKRRTSTREPAAQLKAMAQTNRDLARDYFIFGHAKDFNAGNVREYQSLGLLVVVSINLFHYPQGDGVQQGLDDVQRMLELDVDGLQIDSDYDAGLVKN